MTEILLLVIGVCVGFYLGRDMSNAEDETRVLELCYLMHEKETLRIMEKMCKLLEKK